MMSGKAGPEPVLDAEGYNLKPNPLTASTAAELVATLREYRAWAGSPPFRRMAAQARHKVAYTTMWNALNGDELPKFDVVLAIIQGCGGSQEDLRAFATAHRRINLGKLGSEGLTNTPPRALPPPPRPATDRLI
jgi:hypothetical protein